MPPLNLHVRVWGRPVKPVAFGFVIYMIAFMVYNLLDMGVFGSSLYGDVLAVVAGASFILLTIGWWNSSQSQAELGLLLASTVFIARATFLLLVVGFSYEGVYFSVGAAIIAAGSYLLEKMDRLGEERRRPNRRSEET